MHKYTDSNTIENLFKEFDNAADDRDTEKIKKLIESGKVIADTAESLLKIRLYYSIATAYGDLQKIECKRNVNKKMVKQELYYFRMAIELFENVGASELDAFYLSIKIMTYTNYANALDTCGRKIAAMKYYNKALENSNDFGMAQGNLGIAWQHYSMLVTDQNHRIYFDYFAHKYLNAALNSKSIYLESKPVFQRYIDVYPETFILLQKLEDIDAIDIVYDEGEKQYREWCWDNTLFLTPLNDLPLKTLKYANDFQHLPDMRVSVKDNFKYHKMFNQLKKEYTFARYQYYLGSNYENNTEHFSEKDSNLQITTYPLPYYSFGVEQIKMSFKTIYGLFDKIAYFINQYFHLGIRVEKVSFDELWRKPKNTKKILSDERVDNFPLASLYWIGKDFTENFGASPNPHARYLKLLRNALEHRAVEIVDSEKTFEENGILYVSKNELEKNTLELISLCREAILCLAMAVGVEEQKNKNLKDIVPQLHACSYDDVLKGV